jgi:hypothetical protein
MSAFTRHSVIPSIAPLAVVGLYFTPVSLIGCVPRGLLALAIVFISLVAGIVIGMRGLRARMKGDSVSGWSIASMCLLALPALLVFGPLG